MNLRFFPNELDDVLNSAGVQKELEQHAKSVVSRARGNRGTSKMTFRTRRGKSRKGGYAQAIMSGEGVLAVEFGSKNNPPYAPLRSAMKSL